MAWHYTRTCRCTPQLLVPHLLPGAGQALARALLSSSCCRRSWAPACGTSRSWARRATDCCFFRSPLASSRYLFCIFREDMRISSRSISPSVGYQHACMVRPGPGHAQEAVECNEHERAVLLAKGPESVIRSHNAPIRSGPAAGGATGFHSQCRGLEAGANRSS
jgi:hypothetical protein